MAKQLDIEDAPRFQICDPEERLGIAFRELTSIGSSRIEIEFFYKDYIDCVVNLAILQCSCAHDIGFPHCILIKRF